MEEDKRLTVIEEKLAFLEKYVGDLDEVVRELALRMDRHGQGVTAIRQLLVEHLGESDGSSSDPADEKPPHW